VGLASVVATARQMSLVAGGVAVPSAVTTARTGPSSWMPSSDHVSQRYLAGRGALRSRCTQLLRLTGFEVGIGDDALVTERGKLGQLVSYGTLGVIGSRESPRLMAHTWPGLDQLPLVHSAWGLPGSSP
jgi:hypothetical protein